MPGVVPNIKAGPSTWPVAASTTITGGQLVHPKSAATGTVEPSSATSIDVLGVAANDAGNRTSQDGQNPANLAQAPDYVAVWYNVDIDVTYAADTAAGVLLAPAATGQVTPWTRQGGSYAQAAGDPALIVGRCSEPGGVTVSTKATGAARIGIL